MAFYVYILQSTVTGLFYCGQTDNLKERLNRHNSGEVKSTKHGAPWKQIFSLEMSSRSEAMQLEKTIKNRGIERWLVKNSSL